MTKVNFKKLRVKTSLKADAAAVEFDGAADFADILYKLGAGIAAHALALKIYNADGEIELSADEAQIVEQTANLACTPRLIDAITEQLKKAE